MEKLPKTKDSGINRIVNAPEGEEGKILEHFKKALGKEGIDRSELKEHPPELEQLINGLNPFIREFVSNYGGAPVEISPKSILVPDLSKITEPERLNKILRQVEGTRGSHSSLHQNIFVFFDYDPKSKLEFLATLIHELMHLNSFNSLESGDEGKDDHLKLTKKDEDKESGINLYKRRSGWLITGPGKPNFFEAINEAITSELQIRFDLKFLKQIPDIQDELTEREDAIQALAKRENKSEDEIRATLAYIKKYPDKEDPNKTIAELNNYPYPKQRSELKGLISRLFEANRDKFKEEEEIFLLFVKGYFTGDILPVARLYEQTYGKGTFRELGKATQPKTTSN